MTDISDRCSLGLNLGNSESRETHIGVISPVLMCSKNRYILITEADFILVSNGVNAITVGRAM